MPTFREEPWESDRLASEDFARREARARRASGQCRSSSPLVVPVRLPVPRWSLRQRLQVIVLAGVFLVLFAVVLASLANSVR